MTSVHSRANSRDVVSLLLLVMALLILERPSSAQDTFSRGRDRIQAVSQTLSHQMPLVIAHRGASGYLPEHTTESAAFAHALGADFIEQDVVVSRDGVPVVLHDVTLNAVTDVKQRFPDRNREGEFLVFDFTLAELRQLRVHERRANGRFPKSQGAFQITTLNEHLDLISGMNRSRGTNTGVYVEIKQPALHREQGIDISRIVLQVLRKHGYTGPTDRAFVQCFDASETLRLRTEFDCQLMLIQLFGNRPSTEELAATARVADGIGVPLSSIIGEVKDGEPTFTKLCDQAHRHSMLVHAWTLRDDKLPAGAESVDQAIDWLVRDGGADGVFTDFPDSALAWRENAKRKNPVRGPFHLLKGGAARSDKP